jgi:lipopolysaccharide export LptBFGC system permease protein LptF
MIRKITGIICCVSVIFLPFGIAVLRNRENKLLVFFVNLLFPTIIFWIIAFFMSLKARDPRNQ